MPDEELDKIIEMLKETRDLRQRAYFTAKLLAIVGAIHDTPFHISEWIEQAR